MRVKLALALAAALLMGAGAFVVLRHSPESAGGPPLAWDTSHDAALARAKAEHRPAIVDFTADWCAACQELERQTYVDPAVRREMMRFARVKVDSTAMDEPIQSLFAHYGILALPAVVFIDSAGTVLTTPRLSGFVGPPRMLELLAAVK